MPQHYRCGNVCATPIPVSRMYKQARAVLTPSMEIYEIRRKQLARLVRAKGGPTLFGDAVNRSQSQISQLLTQKQMGSRLARELEDQLGLPRGWMDHYIGPGDEVRETAQGYGLTDEQKEWLALFERLSPKRRADLTAVGRAFLEPDDDADGGDA